MSGKGFLSGDGDGGAPPTATMALREAGENGRRTAPGKATGVPSPPLPVALFFMDALLGDTLGFSVIPYFSLTFSSFLATADDDVDTPEDKDVKPAVVVVADAVLDLLAGVAVTDGKGDSTGDKGEEFKAATVVVVVVVVRGGGGNANASGSAVVVDAVVAILAELGVFGFVLVVDVAGDALALLLGEAVTDFTDGDFFTGDFTVLVALGF
jgi:hypothetical protein